SAESGQPGADPPGDPEFNAKTRGRQAAKKRRKIREFFAFLRLCVIATLRLNPALSSFEPGYRSPLLAFAGDRAELRRAGSVTLKGVAVTTYSTGAGRSPSATQENPTSLQRPRSRQPVDAWQSAAESV